MFREMTREDWVGQFNEAGGKQTFEEGGSLGLYVSVFGEELAEFNAALAEYALAPTEENRAEMIKEWADVQFTLSNFPWFLGFDGTTAFNRVAQSNMSKVVDGKVIYREDGKILKPDTYQAPDMKGL